MSDLLSLQVDFLRDHVRVTAGVPAGSGEVHALQAYAAYPENSPMPRAEALLEAFGLVMEAAKNHTPPSSRRPTLAGLDEK